MMDSQRVDDGVRRGALPDWMTRTLPAAKEYFSRHYHSWADHFGTVTDDDGRDLLVAEPYGLQADDFDALASFAASTGCRVRVAGRGTWSNGTLRIVVEPPPHDDDARYVRQPPPPAGDDGALVYGLKDPRTGRFFYVGQTTDVPARVRQHLSLSPSDGSQEKRDALRSIKAAGAEPEVVVLEECGPHRSRSRERDWIVKLRTEGHPLTNREYGRTANAAPREWVELADQLKTVRGLLYEVAGKANALSGKNGSAYRHLRTAAANVDRARCRLDGELFRLMRGHDAGLVGVFYGE